MGSSLLEAGFIVRRLRPCASDVAPGFTLEQTGGTGFCVLFGARKGFRLSAMRNNVETPLDFDLQEGMTFPCKFDALKLYSNTTDAQLFGANNEGDDVELWLAIFTDSRVLANAASRENWIPRTDVATVSNQNIAANATYTVWSDVPVTNTVGGTGNGYPGTPWVDRWQPGPLDGVSGPPFVRSTLQKPFFAFATETPAIVTAPEWGIVAFVDRDNPAAGQYLYERGAFATATWGGTSFYYCNSNRLGSAALQHGILWPARGGALQVFNPAGNPTINIRGFLGFVGQT